MWSRRIVRSAALCLLIGLPALAQASPWTLPRGDLVISGTWAYDTATKEYFEDRTSRRAFPLRGEYTANTYTIGVRGGFTDRIELELQVPIRSVSYQSDPFLTAEQPADDTGRAIDFYQDNILNFSQGTTGVGDLRLAMRYNLIRTALASALEFRIKAPTGYDPPAGTFGEEPKTAEEFRANIAEIARPDRVRDDITLGDGQLDLGVGFLVGRAFESGTFVRLDTGYDLRLGGAADQVLASFRVGQLFSQKLLLYAGVDLAYAVESGDVIGISVAAQDPDLPANRFDEVDNLLLREVPLERDELKPSVGVIFRLAPGLEINSGYSQVVWGRNTAAIQTLFFSVAVRTKVEDG